MKNIEVNYTVDIKKVLEYWQLRLEKLWSKHQKINEEIEMIDNTISYLKALDQAVNSQINVIIQDETENGN